MSNYVSKGYTTPTGVDSREEVRQWQKRLGVTADGIWGKNTEAAYQAWQQRGWESGYGSKKRSRQTTSPATLPSRAGSSKPKATTQQKSTGSVSGGWRERMGHTGSNVTGGKTAADPLPTPQWNSAGLGVSGIGAQLAAARGATQQNTTPKKTYPLSEYEYPMHSTGAGGIGGQMHAEEIAAETEEKSRDSSSTLQTRIPLRQRAAITAHWAAFRRACLWIKRLRCHTAAA